jgi:hypothetical protein
MTAQTVKMSPQRYARIGGALYLFIIVSGIFAEAFVRSKLIAPTDAVATASNIMAHEFLFRIGHAGELMHLTCDVAVAMILYVLLRPVDRNLALLAAFLRLVMVAIYAITGLTSYAALRLLEGADYLQTFQPDQLHSFALLAMKLHGDGYSIALVFFGFACLVLGYLLFRASYFPKFLGVLMLVAGLGYLTNSFAHFLNPAFAAMLFPAVLMPAFVAELSLALWLIVKGVDSTKWGESAHGLWRDDG